MSQQLTFGYSPCPNDTFMFNALAEGTVEVAGCSLKPVLHDIETLNALAVDEAMDISKLSFYAWMANQDRYQLLSNGAAMGFGCGPVLIAKKTLAVEDIDDCRVVLPGRWTTAHLLFRLWAPRAHQREFVTYDQIVEVLASGRADCGVIIHESRFTFEKAGFKTVVDLGAWWEKQTGLPIPLGCIAARKTMGQKMIERVDTAIHRSIRRAMEDPDRALPYIRKHAQEIDDGVLQTHIRTFVNEFSLGLPREGYQAIDTLETMARSAGVL